jgi:hypothetical protein
VPKDAILLPKDAILLPKDAILLPKDAIFLPFSNYLKNTDIRCYYDGVVILKQL